MESYKSSNARGILILLFIAFSVFSAQSAQNTDETWNKLLISYEYEVQIWGYDMSESSLNKSEYWVNENYKSVKQFDYDCGIRVEDDGETPNYDAIPYVTKIDDTHIALHGLFKDFRGLFTSNSDNYIIGEIDFENNKITFEPQEYADGYMFASAPNGGNNDYTTTDLKAVVVEFSQSSWASSIGTAPYNSLRNSFGIYEPIENNEGHYSCTIGQCGFWIRGEHDVVSYIFNPTSATVLPTDNPITEIQGIVLTLPSEVYENTSISTPITVKKDGKRITGLKFTTSVDRSDSFRYIIELNNPLTEVGTYSFTIPKGYIGNRAYSESKFQNGNSNPKLDYTFTIVDTEKLEYDFDLVSSDPANGETLDRLSQFKLTFASPVSINEAYISDIKGLYNGTVSVDESDANSVIVSLGYEYVNAGEDTFSFPQGLFGDSKYGEDFSVGHANPAFEVKYTISGKYQMYFDMEPTEIDPKSYETYDEVTVAKITFDVPVVINEEIAATAFMYKDSYQQSNPISSIVVSSDDDKTVIVTFSNPLVEAGIYDITIPQGSIGDATYGIDYTYGHANKEFRFRYTISGLSGIDSVMTDDENGEVEFFNLQGVKVNKENLVPGIYIRKCGKKTEKICIR